MRILMLTQWFDPEPTFKGLLFAKELTKRGHEVRVLTGFPNYPGGRLYKGYRVRPWQSEILDGIPVFRVPLYPSHDKSAIRRAANYLSFALSAATLGSFVIKPADVMYVYHPPATVGLPASVISFFRRIPFVYDIQDLWPDTLAATGMMSNRTVLYFMDTWCKFIYNRASKITVLSPGFKQELCKRGVPAEKVEVVYNWCDEGQFRASDPDKGQARSLGLEGKFNIVFAGTMGKAQALCAVLDAAAIISRQFFDIQFVFVGGGIEVEQLRQKTKEMDLTNVLFLPRRPVSEIGTILNSADVLLVHLKDDPLFKITIPSKTQAYMATGKPILIGVGGDAEELVVKNNAGFSCLPERPESIAEAIKKMYTMPRSELKAMGVNGRRFYNENLSLAVGVRRFEDIFTSVIKR